MSNSDWHAGWQRDFQQAQAVTELVINSREYDRVPYGGEEWDLHAPKCGDCGVPRGALHLLGCDLESCPRCTGQIISCDCFFDVRPGEPSLRHPRA